jgi:hypothetical protein
MNSVPAHGDDGKATHIFISKLDPFVEDDGVKELGDGLESSTALEFSWASDEDFIGNETVDSSGGESGRSRSCGDLG